MRLASLYVSVTLTWPVACAAAASTPRHGGDRETAAPAERRRRPRNGGETAAPASASRLRPGVAATRPRAAAAGRSASPPRPSARGRIRVSAVAAIRPRAAAAGRSVAGVFAVGRSVPRPRGDPRRRRGPQTDPRLCRRRDPPARRGRGTIRGVAAEGSSQWRDDPGRRTIRRDGAPADDPRNARSTRRRVDATLRSRGHVSPTNGPVFSLRAAPRDFETMMFLLLLFGQFIATNRARATDNAESWLVRWLVRSYLRPTPSPRGPSTS